MKQKVLIRFMSNTSWKKVSAKASIKMEVTRAESEGSDQYALIKKGKIIISLTRLEAIDLTNKLSDLLWGKKK